MTETTQIDAASLGYGPAEPNPIPDTPSEPASPRDDASSSSRNSSTSSTPVRDHASKASLRRLMVSCIDSALEELGPLGDASQDIKKLPATTNTSNTASSMPSAEELYGYSAPKICPELKLSGRIRRGPRYQRRGSVTKFSLSNALKQVQKEDREGKLQPMASSPLWQHFYAKMDSQAPLKRTALNFSAPAEGSSAKRRRACL